MVTASMFAKCLYPKGGCKHVIAFCFYCKCVFAKMGKTKMYKRNSGVTTSLIKKRCKHIINIGDGDG